MLTEAQEKFIKKRKTLTKLWNLVGAISLIVIVACWSYFFVRSPLLFNPFYLVKQAGSGTLSNTTLTILATLGSFAFLACGFLLVVIIIFIFGAMANERKLLKIIDELKENKQKS